MLDQPVTRFHSITRHADKGIMAETTCPNCSTAISSPHCPECGTENPAHPGAFFAVGAPSKAIPVTTDQPSGTRLEEDRQVVEALPRSSPPPNDQASDYVHVSPSGPGRLKLLMMKAFVGLAITVFVLLNLGSCISRNVTLQKPQSSPTASQAPVDQQAASTLARSACSKWSVALNGVKDGSITPADFAVRSVPDADSDAQAAAAGDATRFANLGISSRNLATLVGGDAAVMSNMNALLAECRTFGS